MKNLPSSPNLDHLRKQAKHLLKSWRDADPADPRKLADAQHALAQDYGFKTWADIKLYVQSLNPPEDPAEWVTHTILRERVSEPDPRNVASDFFTAIASNNLAQVKKFIGEDPSLATTKGGPLDCEPICYSCCTCYHGGDPVGVTRLLLDNGADPNAKFISPAWPDYPLPVLWGACGKLRNPDLARLLLERGADPNDGESMYHSTESADTSCLRVLLEYKASLEKTNALPRALDFARIEAVQLLLDYGADPNDTTVGETAIHHAIRRGRGLPFIKLLVEHGQNLNAKSREGWPVLKHALLRSKPDVVEYLRSLGLTDDLKPIDQYVAAVTQNDRDTAHRLLKENPEILRGMTHEHLALVVAAAWNNDAQLVARYFEFGWPTPSPETTYKGEPQPGGPTAMHAACFMGHLETVKVLVAYKADMDRVETQHGSSPIGWAAWSYTNSQEGNDDGKLECIKYLLESGAKIPDQYPFNMPEVDALFTPYV